MNFHKRINEQLSDWRRLQEGGRGVLVDRRALEELVDDYGRLDSYHRSHSKDGMPPDQLLHHQIRSYYLENGKNTERTIYMLTGAIRSFLEESYASRSLKR